MEAFFLFISFICTVLGIVLFFKVWEMTNNVKEIKRDLSGSARQFAEAFAPKLIEAQILAEALAAEVGECSEFYIDGIDPDGGYSIHGFWPLKVGEAPLALYNVSARIWCDDTARIMDPAAWHVHLKTQKSQAQAQPNPDNNFLN